MLSTNPRPAPNIATSADCPISPVMRPWHEQFGDQRGPPRLVRGPDPASGVAVKILVERDAVLVMGVRLQLGLVTQHGPLAVGVLQENARQAMRQLGGDLLDREIAARSRRAFHLEVIAVVMMKFLQRLDNEEIQ